MIKETQSNHQKGGAMMPKLVHGHEVMQMMIASGKTYTKDSLRTAIVRQFGDEARFHTCSAENMTPDQLIDFLNARGKFLVQEDGFKTDASKICNHE